MGGCVPIRRSTFRARRLRNAPTDAERRLWRMLRGRQVAGLRFRRQHPVGPYFADFACIEAGLIIEADGNQHSEREPSDRLRDQCLAAAGFRVLRFSDREILTEPAQVADAILLALRHPPPSPSPASRGRGSDAR